MKETQTHSRWRLSWSHWGLCLTVLATSPALAKPKKPKHQRHQKRPKKQKKPQTRTTSTKHQSKRDLRETKIRWKQLRRGVSYAVIPLGTKSKYGDNKLRVVRILPSQVKFRILLAKHHGNRKRTAAEWVRQYKLAAAVNMGMFQTDHRTHVGYMRHGKRIESRGWRKHYLSMFVVGPRRKGLPYAQVLDLDAPKAKALRKQYKVAIQNLRLIKRVGRRGVSVWKKKRRRWSELALGMDRKGRILFLCTRTPYSMWRLNRMLLRLPLGIVRAMHLEGGPEASLSIHTRTFKAHFNGSYETGFQEDDKVRQQWKIPNIIGVVR